MVCLIRAGIFEGGGRTRFGPMLHFDLSGTCLWMLAADSFALDVA